MAGDWIKMRSDLFTHPKIVRMASALKADKLRTVGGLMSVWCLFDAHSVDGDLDGYTFAEVDEHLRWPGFADAMCAIGWLSETEKSLVLPEFDTHNGQSAKRRAQDADRKKEVRKASASDADKLRTREEKRREEKKEEIQGEAPRKRSTQTPSLAKPDDVDQQTWGDWLALRKAKRAPVTETVVMGARDEANKAVMTLDAFLQVWCLRGSQGLQADWLRPEERRTASRVQPVSFAQQDKADKRAAWEAMTGRQWPGADNVPEFIDAEDINPKRIAA
jgi:hypothetical protein